MEINGNPFDRFFIKLGQFISTKPRAAGVLMVFAFILIISGWYLAGFYYSAVEILPSEKILSSINNETDTANPTDINTPATTTATNTVATPAQAALPPPLPGEWQTVTVRRGDSLHKIFKRIGISQQQLVEIVALGEPVSDLTRLKPGETIKLLISSGNQLQQLIYAVDPQNNLIVTRTDTGFSVTQQSKTAQLEQQIETTVANTPTPPPQIVATTTLPDNMGTVKYGSAIIQRSLYTAGINAGLSKRLALQLTEAVSQSQDISKNIRRGAQLSVLYQANQVDSSTKKGSNSNNILLIDIKNRDKNYQLIRFTDPKGHNAFYTADGMSLSPPVMRRPVNATRISSYFSTHRWQPILHYFRPHYGVDYAAPEGTPIVAAGDGKIIFEGVKTGFGNVVMIRHADHIDTLYAHMQHFASNVHFGSYVQQGEVIGYVGMTGLATGPHLHFEIHVDNVPRNPLTVALPSGAPINYAYRTKFFATTHLLLADLNQHQPQFAVESLPARKID